MSKSALAELGMDSIADPSGAQVPEKSSDIAVYRPAPAIAGGESHPWPVIDGGKDYFIERNGVKYAGTHLLIDLWGARNLDRLETVETALTKAAEAAGATILHTHLHHFTPNGGISGVVVLAESHISIHTWPERKYAALDIFMCGACDPYKAIPILRRHFQPERVQLGEQKRGLVG